jgi:hypothetical protein
MMESGKDVRFRAHDRLKSDIAPCPFCADIVAKVTDIAPSATGHDLGKHAQMAIISHKHCSGSDAMSQLRWLRSRERRYSPVDVDDRGFDLNCGFRRAIDSDGPGRQVRGHDLQSS